MRKTMHEFVWYTTIWPVLCANSIISSARWISMSTNNSLIQGIALDPFLLTGRGDVAYMIADISEVREDQIKDIYKKLAATPFNIVTRMLY
jgi:hypothetical protein